MVISSDLYNPQLANASKSLAKTIINLNDKKTVGRIIRKPGSYHRINQNILNVIMNESQLRDEGFIVPNLNIVQPNSTISFLRVTVFTPSLTLACKAGKLRFSIKL